MKTSTFILFSCLRGSVSFAPSTLPSLVPIRTASLGSRTYDLQARRPLLSEDDLATPPNPKVIEAVEKMGGNNVLASDVAVKAGLSLSATKQSLSALASLTRGDISVSESGDLLYSFPSSIQQALSSNSLRYRITKLWKQDIWPKLFWSIRIAFGVFLFVSIALIFSTLLFVQTGTSNRDDRDDDRRGGSIGGFGRYGMGDFLFDVFYPRPWGYGPYYGYYGRIDPFDRRRTISQEDDRPGIFEGIFSYIFGDGDPNRNLELARLREASKIIRDNGGAVTAEQLAPFCDVDDPDEMGNKFLVDESYVLPIVSQLGGEPAVTDDGDIVYLFPDLQVSALEEEFGDSFDSSSYLEENSLEFSRNPAFGNVAAAALGVVNLGGALYLGQILSSPALLGVRLPAIYGLVQAGYPFLLLYAILFNAIPIARYFYTEKTNTEISKRNSARRKWLTYLQVGGSTLKRKLTAAKSMRQKMRRLVGKDAESSVYDTRKKIEDLSAERERDAMRRFDDLLN